MSDGGLKSLEDAWAETMGDTPGDLVDAPEDSVEPDLPDVADVANAFEDDVEQPTERSDGPTKLSDLAQSDDEGQDEQSSPADLVQEITLPNGQTVTVEQVQRWRDEGLMREDYTRKTQELSREREAFESEREQLEAVRELKDMITNDPKGTVGRMAAQLGLIDESVLARLQDVDVEVDPNTLFNKDVKGQDIQALIEQQVQERLQQEFQTNPAFKQAQQQATAARVESIFDSIEQIYEDKLDESDRNFVLRTALENGETDLEKVYLRLASQVAEKNANAKRVRTGRSVSSVPTGTPNKADVVTAPPSSFEEAWERTMKQNA